jgi:hypothetical protein
MLPEPLMEKLHEGVDAPVTDHDRSTVVGPVTVAVIDLEV